MEYNCIVHLQKSPKTVFVEGTANLIQKLKGNVILRQASWIRSLLLLASLLYPSLCDCFYPPPLVCSCCDWLKRRNRSELFTVDPQDWRLKNLINLSFFTTYFPNVEHLFLGRDGFVGDEKGTSTHQYENRFRSLCEPLHVNLFSLFILITKGKDRKRTQLVFRLILKNWPILETVLHGTWKPYTCTAAFRPNKTH